MITEIKPKPSSFDVSKLKGLSANLIESHWANNYSGSVKTLNAVNAQLSQALANPDTPLFLKGAIAEAEFDKQKSKLLGDF